MRRIVQEEQHTKKGNAKRIMQEQQHEEKHRRSSVRRIMWKGWHKKWQCKEWGTMRKECEKKLKNPKI